MWRPEHNEGKRKVAAAVDQRKGKSLSLAELLEFVGGHAALFGHVQ